MNEDDPLGLGLTPPRNAEEADRIRKSLHSAMVLIENAPPWAMAELHSELGRLERVAEYMAKNVALNR